MTQLQVALNRIGIVLVQLINISYRFIQHEGDKRANIIVVIKKKQKKKTTDYYH